MLSTKFSDEKLEHIKQTDKRRYRSIIRYREYYAQNREKICQQHREDRKNNLEAYRKAEQFYRNQKKKGLSDDTRNIKKT